MTGDMSIHQLTAYFTLLQMHKTVTTQKPSYLANKLVLRKPTVDERVFPHRHGAPVKLYQFGRQKHDNIKIRIHLSWCQAMEPPSIGIDLIGAIHI